MTWGAPLKHTTCILLLAVAGLLSACTVGPNYQPPNFALESSYGPGSPNALTDAAWWHGLNDEQLDKLIATAAENSLDIRQAQARLREARAQWAATVGQDLPQLNADAGYNRQRFSQNAAPFNAFNVPGFPWEFNVYQVGFDANWEIDVFGGSRRAVEAASASVEASQED